MIKEPSTITYPYGFTYSHFRGDWLFCFSGRLYNFKFGADWNFNKWELNDLDLYFGFFHLNWTRIYNKVDKRKGNDNGNKPTKLGSK